MSVGLLDHFGHRNAVFVGHDWGSMVVWNLALLHPSRVRAVANLSVPYFERMPKDPIEVFEDMAGTDFYIVHFNRQPGGWPTRPFEANTANFLRNLYRTGQWRDQPRDLGPGMALINMAEADAAEIPGRLLMSEAELAVFVDTFEQSGFTGGLNWYRNFTRNWETTAEVRERVDQPALMLYGRYDMVQQNPRLDDVCARCGDPHPGVRPLDPARATRRKPTVSSWTGWRAAFHDEIFQLIEFKAHSGIQFEGGTPSLRGAGFQAHGNAKATSCIVSFSLPEATTTYCLPCSS